MKEIVGKKSTPINVTISSTDQTLPVEMDSFWSSSKNKVELQMCFINWICKSYVDSKPVYLGGSHPEDITKCVKVCDGISEDIRLLKCDHEEADDRIMYHINHAVTVQNYEKVIVASTDTDIFICLIYHFTRWNFLNLQEIWMLCGQGATKRAVPIHEIATILDNTITDILPQVHALTGCDTTSKIGTKRSALQVASTPAAERLINFAKESLTDEMIWSAEQFLVKVFNPKSSVNTFDELRYLYYHDKLFKFNVETMPPTSISIVDHIKRAYYQCHQWLNSPFIESDNLDVSDFGYVLNDDLIITPSIQYKVIPDDFTMPCKCQKCARQTVCPCRVKSIPCCNFCKCKSDKQCKNDN